MTPQEKLAALPGKWRKTGALLIESQRVAYESCADELTTTLSEHGEGGEAVAPVVTIDLRGGGRLANARISGAQWLKILADQPHSVDSCYFIGDGAGGPMIRRANVPQDNPPTLSAPVGVEERVRGIIALLRQPEPDNGEKYTEHDAGYDQASREIATMLERALTPPAAAPRVEEGGEKTCCDRAYKDGYDTGKMHASGQGAEWQPIESVPREGDVLLCWTFSNGVAPDIRIGRFYMECYDGSRLFKLELDCGDFGAHYFTPKEYQPTHWMPLPAAPTQENPQ